MLIITPIPFPRLRSLLPSARRRMDELPGPSHREGTPPRRTRCRARMRDPEAPQVGPGSVARLRSPLFIITPISFPLPGSGVSYLPPEGGWTSFRVRPIVRELPSTYDVSRLFNKKSCPREQRQLTVDY